MDAIEFKDREQEIIDAIKNKMKDNSSLPDTDFIIIKGFFNQSIQSRLADDIYVGGPTVPMVAVAGKTTGRMYFFALKLLLPDIKL